MNIEIENEFIETFIAKNRRERLKYELKHPQKRFLATDRFSHRAAELLTPENIVFRGEKMTLEEAENALFQLSGSKVCYYLAEESGESDFYDLHSCLMKYYYSGPSIFLCKNGVALIVSEYTGGASEKILLAAKREGRHPENPGK